jgi:putative transposase
VRTVKRGTLDLNTKKQKELEALCSAYTREKQKWVQEFRSWDYQADLGRPRTIRDEKIKQKYQSPHGLQARHWKLALQDAAETWDKYWQAVFVKVRSKISLRKDLSETERHYAYWLLQNTPAFASLMQKKYPTPPFPIELLSKKRVVNYVKNQIRKNRGNPPVVKKAKSVRFDADCYETFLHKGRQYIRLMSLTPGKRISIPLSGLAKISGTITLVFSEKGLALHVSQELKKKPIPETGMEAVDFGYAEVMTDTQGIRYGTQFGAILTKGTENRHQKMQKRHKLYAIRQKKGLSQTRKLQKYNLGKEKQHRTMESLKSALEREINTGIHQLIRTKQPSILVTEDLRHAFSHHKSKKVNRKLSSWSKGKLQDRVAFKALTEGFRHEQVNPAYGSQSCPNCEFVDRGNRKEDCFQCLHCGHEGQSDRIAAMNYARRLGDPEIERYTPYREVKPILLGRFHRRLETGKPVTVPGRTLETVVGADPSLLSRLNIIARKEKSCKLGGQSKSETKDKHGAPSKFMNTRKLKGVCHDKGLAVM